MNYINDFSPSIRQGDTCVIHISEHMRYTLKIEPDVELQTKFGIIRGVDLVGHPYGVRYECKRGWILPLRLTPELWTQLLPHRTQILYQADISMILLQLDIKPGTIVAESGTGSGSLSHAILRACLPNGYLYTFDIDESRVNEAQKEFLDHGYGNNVSVGHRNVCELGYGDELCGKVDACILDLPQTWSAIEHAYKVLKPEGSRLCTFSPCVEQVQQNVAKMMELKFKDIVTMECLLRPLEVKVQKLRTWDEDILDGLVAIDNVRIENLKLGISQSKRSKLDDESNGPPTGEGATPTEIDLNSKYTPDDSENLNLLRKVIEDPKASFTPQILPKKSYTVAKQLDETVSHSGFLTFASKRP